VEEGSSGSAMASAAAWCSVVPMAWVSWLVAGEDD
jgi:hypothetical protein